MEDKVRLEAILVLKAHRHRLDIYWICLVKPAVVTAAAA